MPLRNLPKREVTRLFRKVESNLRNDPMLQNVVDCWKTFGSRDKVSPTPAAKGSVTIRLFPLLEGQEWESPDAHMGVLAIECGMEFDTTDAGDWTDLWFAVQRALYPIGPDGEGDHSLKRAMHLELQNEYSAETGEPQFRSPQPEARQLDDGRFAMVGYILYNVRIALNN